MTSELKISYHKFLPEMVGEVRENIGKMHLFTLNIAGALGLGGLFLGLTGEKLYPEMFIATSGIVALMSGFGLIRTLEEVYRQNAFEKIFPDILGKGSIGLDALKSIMADKVNAVVPEQSHDPLKFKPQSLIPYKKRLILEYAKTIKTERSAGVLYDMLMATPNLELKKYMATMLKRYEPSSKKLDILSKNVFWRTVKKVSGLILTQVEVPKTLQSFAKLFVLRRMKEMVGENQLMATERVTKLLGEELTAELAKFDRAQKETRYSETETTTGLEVQPVTGKHPFPLLVDDKEIKQIVSFAKLGSQDDKPFEIRLYPNVNPISQLLIFREVLALTGIPIERAGVQINFGGVGKKKENILALQRIILAAGRLKLPQEPFKRYGNYWALSNYTGFGISRRKGEVNVRGKLDLAVKRVLPKKFKGKDFGVVSEVRAPVGAESFYVFARGLLAAHNLANMVRESEQASSGIANWEKLCEQLDLTLDQIGLPPVRAEWSKDNWKKFAQITQNPDNELKQTLKKVLK